LAQVVISVGSVKTSFGKPTLILEGEISPARYADKVRHFLRETGATSVAFALNSNQSYWGLYRLVSLSFDWSRPDWSAFTDEDKQEARRLYESGHTQNQLASLFGVSQPAIAYVVTGYPDKVLFQKFRGAGFTTINSIVTSVPGSYFPEAVAKAEQLGLTLHKVGPLLNMLDRRDAKRLREALKRRVKARAKRIAIRKAQGKTGWSCVPDKDLPGFYKARIKSLK
jgi:hypothetical protein